MRKSIRIILAATLILQLLVMACPVSAASGWTVSYSGDVNTDRERYFASVLDDYKFDGYNAMIIKYPGTQQEGNYVEIKTETTEALAEGNYTLTFYNKGSRSTLTEICIGENIVIRYADMTRTSVPVADVPSGESSWYKLTYSFSYPEQEETDYIIFRYNGGTQQTIIDEVSLVAENSTENLIPDPGFEGYEAPDYTDEPYDTTLYQARELIVSPGNEKLGLSWINPKSTELNGIKVYNVTGEEPVLLTDTMSTEAGKTVFHLVEGLVNGETYNFAVKFEFASKPPFTYYMSGIPDPTVIPDVKLGSWIIRESRRGAAGNVPGRVTLEVDETGNTYLKMHSNVGPEVDPILEGNTYFQLLHNVTLEANTRYKLTMRAKSEAVLPAVQMMMEWNGFNEAGGRAIRAFDGTKDWDDYTFTFDVGETIPTLFHIVMEHPGTLYIDDLVFQKVEGSATVGENMFTNGDFEGLIETDVGEIEDFEVSMTGDDSFTAVWCDYSADTQRVNVYRKLFDNYEYRGFVGGGESALKNFDMVLGTEYTYLLCPENGSGIEGTGVEFTVNTKSISYELVEAKLYKASLQVNAPSGAGTYTVQTAVKNYTVDNMPYTQAVAVYKNGELEKLYVNEQTLATQTKGEPALKVNTIFDIGEGSGYSVEVFVMDSMETLNTYLPCKVFE